MYSAQVVHPLERTRPKGDPDPGWRRIGWDEALDKTATALLRLARQHGPECVAFTSASPSTTALSDAVDWIQRLRRAFGSPNLFVSMELCGWGRYLASTYTFGAPVPGAYMPDLEHAGCILFWGYNPAVSRLAHATATVAALARGARLIVVDPRCTGLAHKADPWLHVRPGTDGALALAIADVMIQRGWFDRDFVPRWTNGPLLVRSDDGRFLRGRDLEGTHDPEAYVGWDVAGDEPIPLAPGQPRPGAADAEPALLGEVRVRTTRGDVICRPAFQLTADLCRRHGPEAVEPIAGVEATLIERAARTLWENRPVAFYAWSGVEQHSNATQATRRVELYSEALLAGGYDPLPGFVEPLMSPRSRPTLAERYPLVLTSAKSLWFCESQHRGVPSLRRRDPDPQVEVHPSTARDRGVEAGDWVRIETPDGSVKARVTFDRTLAPDVVCAQHGWWQACEAIGAPGFDPFGPEGANLNLLIRHEPSDPISGSVPHREWICDIVPVERKT